MNKKNNDWRTSFLEWARQYADRPLFFIPLITAAVLLANVGLPGMTGLGVGLAYVTGLLVGIAMAVRSKEKEQVK